MIAPEPFPDSINTELVYHSFSKLSQKSYPTAFDFFVSGAAGPFPRCRAIVATLFCAGS
jgi:hypothetical protein